MQQILVLRVRFIAAKDHIKKKKNFKAITLQLEKEQTKPKFRRKESSKLQNDFIVVRRFGLLPNFSA